MEKINTIEERLVQAHPNVFWGEMAPSEHVVQIYENENVFLDLLEGFVVDGLTRGESVIVIATKDHLAALDDRLVFRNISTETIKLNFQYIPVDAREALSHFMVNRWPDQELFQHFISRILSRARMCHDRVRAFGEMVRILWEQGMAGATIRLEEFWNEFLKSEKFTLFCAYPKNSFSSDAATSMMHICKEHSKVISANHLPD